MRAPRHYVRWFDAVRNADVAIVGGKNASLGEMFTQLTAQGVRVPYGFATTAEAYRLFVRVNHLEGPLRELLARLDNEPVAEVGRRVRELFNRAVLPDAVSNEIVVAYHALSQRYGVAAADVAVRSSATAEDLPEASFAGQQETFLNVSGVDAVRQTCVRCYASLFTDRAIGYRRELGIDHLAVALSVGIQKMVRADLAAAGVMFTLDTDTGFPNVIVINAAWGLGEAVVQGLVTPDEHVVLKPLVGRDDLCPILRRHRGDKQEKIIYASGERTSAQAVDTYTARVDTSPAERESFALADRDVLQLARWGAAIEAHYGRPMDIEWAKDGPTGELFIVQARPETVHARRTHAALRTYTLTEPGEALVQGISIGQAIAAGRVSVIPSVADIGRFVPGSILVTAMTDPDWGPVMKRAVAIVTDHGGRTCHAAIVSRELGIPAVVGTGNATAVLRDGDEVTVSCAEGAQGSVYRGRLAFHAEDLRVTELPTTRTQIMLNIASPDAAMAWWQLPCRGIGLARMEFIINNSIKIHPMALVHFDTLEDPAARSRIAELTRGYADKEAYFVDALAEGIALIAASRYPEPVIVRTSDFKTNEYASLIGGKAFEPQEANPMLGFRGASRYYSDAYREGFALECRALKRVRDEMGLTNVIVMIPFCRRLQEADRVLEQMAQYGLRRGDNGLQVYVMCEIPSNVVLTEEFAKRFDGFSIGSNDLTQLVLGIDRDSEQLADLFDERDPAVLSMIRDVIERAHRAGRKVGICGQAPSDHPDFAAFLVEAGIDSMSLNPDSVLPTLPRVAAAEARLGRAANDDIAGRKE